LHIAVRFTIAYELGMISSQSLANTHMTANTLNLSQMIKYLKNAESCWPTQNLIRRSNQNCCRTLINVWIKKDKHSLVEMTSFFSNALKSIKKRLKKTPLGRFELTIGQPLIIKPVLYHIAIQLLWSVGLNGNDYLT